MMTMTGIAHEDEQRHLGIGKERHNHRADEHDRVMTAMVMSICKNRSTC